MAKPIEYVDLSSYLVDELVAQEGQQVECQDCDWTGTVEETRPIEACALTAGDPSPAGRCPKCDTLAYVLDPLHDAAPDLLAVVKECRDLLVNIDDTDGLIDEDRLLLDKLTTVITKATKP